MCVCLHTQAFVPMHSKGRAEGRLGGCRLAQVMISQSVGLSPKAGSVLTAQSLDLASDSVSPFSLPFPDLHSVSVSLSKINKH